MWYIMWTNKLFLMISILSSLAICVEMGSKDRYPFKVSDPVTQFGKLVVGKGTRLTLSKPEITDGTEDGFPVNLGEYQSDEPGSTAWYKAAQSKLWRLNPSVLCGNDAMTLRVQGSRLPNFMIDRGEAGLVPLTQMPAECGFSVKRARRDVIIVAHYKGCHITHQGESHVLPLRLWGVPVHVSCPLTQHALPTVTCLSSGMVAKTTTISTDVLQLKVDGIWEPLMSAGGACGFTIEVLPDGVAIIAPYHSRCWQVKDGKKLLYVLDENREIALSCPDRDLGGYSNLHVTPTTTPGSVASIMDAPGSGFAFNHDRIMTKATPRTTPSTYPASLGVPASKERPPVYLPPVYYPVHPPLGHTHPNQPSYGHHWAPALASTSSPRTTEATHPASAAGEGRPHAYPLHPMYYAFDPVYPPLGHSHAHQPSDYGHRPPVLVTPTAVPTTVPPIASLPKTTPSTDAHEEHPPMHPLPPMYSPFGHVYSHQPDHGHWVPLFTNVGTTPSTTVLTPTTSAAPMRNPQHTDDHFPFCGLCPLDHPCGFTEEPEMTTPEPPVAAGDLKQPAYPFSQLQYPYGYMLNHHGYLRHKYHPWAPLPNVHEPAPPTIPEMVASDTISHKLQRTGYHFPQIYPFAPGQHTKYQTPWLY